MKCAASHFLPNKEKRGCGTQVCRHLGVGANPFCAAGATWGRAASHQEAINHTARPMRRGPQPRSSPAVMEHAGTLGCFGEDPEGRELETCPPRGNISSHFLLCDNPLSKEPTCRTLRSPEIAQICSARGSWAAAPRSAARTGPLQRQNLRHQQQSQRDQPMAALPSVLQTWHTKPQGDHRLLNRHPHRSPGEYVNYPGGLGPLQVSRPRRRAEPLAGASQSSSLYPP